jgi:hypothetical protein
VVIKFEFTWLKDFEFFKNYIKLKLRNFSTSILSLKSARWVTPETEIGRIGRPDILTEGFRGFSQSVQANGITFL